MRRNSTLAPARRKTRPKVPEGVRHEVRARTHGLCALCLFRASPDWHRLPKARLRELVRAGHVRRIAHLHHVFPVETWPVLAKRAANLMGLCTTCHGDHHAVAGHDQPRRIPRAALLPETLELAGDDGPRTNYLERTYPLADAGRLPADRGGVGA